MSSDCRGRAKGRDGVAPDEQNGFAFCQSSECFRCTSAGESLNQRLYHSLQEYAKRYTWSGMGRVHKGVRDQGRYLNSRPSIQRPEVFFLPDLPSAPFFSREVQRHDVEVLEQSFPTLLEEFESIYHQPPARGGSALPPGWKANNTPSGQWWTYYLVNQGMPLLLNARRCPRAWRVLGQLRTFIANNVFGNACFSVLTPGAVITEHYGPTNIRLRCHVGKNQTGSLPIKRTERSVHTRDTKVVFPRQVSEFRPPVSWWSVENLSAGLKPAVCFLMTPSSTGPFTRVRDEVQNKPSLIQRLEKGISGCHIKPLSDQKNQVLLVPGILLPGSKRLLLFVIGVSTVA